MSAVVFLLLALAIIVVGSALVYFRQRTPSSLDAGIDSFRREMEALAVRQGNGNGDGGVHGIHGRNGNGGGTNGARNGATNGNGNGADVGVGDDPVDPADSAAAASDEPGAAAPSEAAGPPGPARGKG